MSKTIVPLKQNHKRYNHFPYEILIFVEGGERPVQIRDTTLALCKAYKIPAEKISVCLAEKSQEAEFRKQLLPGTFGNLFAGFSAVPEFFQSGTPLVYMDSCITGLWEYNESVAGKKQPLKSLRALIEYAFAECKKTGSLLWGVQPIKPTTVLEKESSTHLRHIHKALSGCIFSGLDTHISANNDIERTLFYYNLTHIVLSLNMFGVSTCKKCEYSESFLYYLTKQYPDLIHITRTEKGIKFRIFDKRKKKHKV
jgi:hypothetical protein